MKVEIFGKISKEKCANENTACFFIPWSVRLNSSAIYAENTTKSQRKLGYKQA